MVGRNPNPRALQTVKPLPMDEERFAISKENPRPIAYPAKLMSNELAPKTPPTVLERFRSMLKDRDDELRDSPDGDVPPPSSEEIVLLYELFLSELTLNSKPIITDLTIIAGEQREHGEGIADAICARIVEVPVEQKLPSLYLLDSIVKNIGREYIRHFSSRLPEVSGLLHKVFCEAYRQVNPSLYAAMRHLFSTWSAVFPPSVLRKIESQLQFSPPTNHHSSGLTPLRDSESPRPTHGIHVNPKYLEARRQFENSTIDSRHETDSNSNAVHMTAIGRERMENTENARESATLKSYGQKPSLGYDEYDSDHADITSSKLGTQRLGSIGRASHTSLPPAANKQHSFSSARLVRSSSPLRVGPDRSLVPAGDEFAANNSPRRLVERASPSRHVFDYGLGRAIANDEETSDWRRTDDNHQQSETTATYSLSNGRELERPRALIDAYGNDRGKGTQKSWNDRPLKVKPLNVNGIDKVGTKSWLNTEEEEYDWEDMSPTLADGRSNDYFSSNPPAGSFRTRPGFGMVSAAPLEPDFRRSNWSNQVHPPAVDPYVVSEDTVPTLSFGRGSASQLAGFQNEANQIRSSHYPQEVWNQPHHLPQSSHFLNAKGRGRTFQMPFPAGEKMPPLNGSIPDVETQHRRHPIIPSRMGSSGFECMNVDGRLASVGTSTGAWPSVEVHKSHPLPVLSILPQQKRIRSQYDLMNAGDTVTNQGPYNPMFPEQQFGNFENKIPNSTKLLHLPNHHGGLIPLNQRNQAQGTPLLQQYRPPQGGRENFGPTSTAAQVSSHLMAPSLNHGYTPKGLAVGSNTAISNPVSGVYLPTPIHQIPNNTLHLQGLSMPPLPPGPRPAASQMIPSIAPIVPNQPPGNTFSGLINSLMSQGLISLTNQAPVQDSVGLEFNPDLLKVRHESAIRALYADLPRQCKSCGLRFKCQEEHSSHMDWHVTKNRINKNRKQKPSRKWFASCTMWLSGAEASGSDAAPRFLPTETTEEKKDDEEMAVPADEDQNVCALCGEPFDDFYSDEMEEWMYKGAVYLNAPNGSTVGMDRSQLGPIVHAKCRSEDFGRDEGVNTAGLSK